MAKSPNTELGTIECEGCGTFASIRRRANGKQLLYLHCKNCGLDQRSGAKLQAKWAKAISTETQQSQATQSEPQEALNHTPATDEWAPKIEKPEANIDASEQRITSGTTEDSDSASNGGSGVWGWLGLAVIGAIAIATGTRLQSS